MITLLLPIFAFFGLILFRKSRYNFSEYCIIAGTNFSGIMIFYDCTLPLMLFSFTTSFSWIAQLYDLTNTALLMIFIGIGYYMLV